MLLTKPGPESEGEEGRGCYIHLARLARLNGYRVVGVELQSAARVVELYSGQQEDYVATSKGSKLEDTL